MPNFKLITHPYCYLLLLVFLLSPAAGFGEGHSPTEVVQHWLRVYPKDMVRAAELTTTACRQGLTKEEWISTQGPLLRNLRFKYLHGSVLFQRVQGDQAQVVVQVRVLNTVGTARSDRSCTCYSKTNMVVGSSTRSRSIKKTI